MALKLGALGVTSEATGVQIRSQPLGSLNDLGVGVAAVALNDEFAVTDRGRDGVGGSWDGDCVVEPDIVPLRAGVGAV